MFYRPGSKGLIFIIVFHFSIFIDHFAWGESENYCTISSCAAGQHTMCLYPNSAPSARCNEYNTSGLLNENESEALVKRHNKLREKVAKGLESLGNPGPQPSASNMKILTWDNELARIAQRHADQCSSGHDKCRNVGKYNVGQNIATMQSTAMINPNVVELMQGWYDEVSRFNNNYVQKYAFESATGHYTQLVWANTSTIGCARVSYKDVKNGGMFTVRLICNYGPAGNFIGQQIYDIGNPGSACTNGVSKDSASLCN